MLITSCVHFITAAMTVTRFVEEFCEILRAPNTPDQLDRLITFLRENETYIANNRRQLGGTFAGTDIFPVLRGVIEYISSETSDRQRLEAARWLYYTLSELQYSNTVHEPLCRARVPEIVARHCHSLHPKHKLDTASKDKITI